MTTVIASDPHLLAKFLCLTPDDVRGMTTEEALMRALARRAVRDVIRGKDLEACREIGDRHDPKPRRVEIRAPDGIVLRAQRIERGMTDAEAANVYRSMLDSPAPGEDAEAVSANARSEEPGRPRWSVCEEKLAQLRAAS